MLEGIKSKLMAAAAAAGMLAAAPAQAVVVTVYAKGNSSSGGFGLNAITLEAGQSFTVTADAGDLWSAGALPRYSNADGLVKKLYATGSDESAQAAGTLIGDVFPLWTQNGFTAPYGSLVGLIGGSYILLGDSYGGAAPAAGTLQLFYWDSNNHDNFGSIKVDVSASPTPGAVPEPGTVFMMLAGFGLAGWVVRKRKSGARAVRN